MPIFNQNAIVLDARLRAIADCVPNGARFADIGCDHGYLSAWLLQQKRVVNCQLCDISELSLKKARELFQALGMDTLATFHVGDGAEALAFPVDCAAIAGMGSTTIIHIISEGRELFGKARLVLQPNVDAPDLRAFLAKVGYCIVEEKLARTANRHYVVIAVEPGNADYSPMELLCGPVLLKKRDPLFRDFADFRIRIAEKALRGAQGTDSSRAKELWEEIRMWEDAVKTIEQ